MKAPSRSAAERDAGDPRLALPAPRASRGRPTRVTVVAFAISAVVHLLLVIAYPLLFGPPPAGPSEPPASSETPVQGLRVVDLIESDATPDVQRPDEPVESTTPVPVVPGPRAAPEPAPRAAAPSERPRTAAEEVRPRAFDPRLTEPLPPELTEVSEERMAQLRLLWRIEELADSMAAASEAAGRGTDWTYTDGEGRKWGISPGKLHLGDITLPLPSFSAPANSEALRRVMEDAELRSQLSRALAAESREERAKAMRERIDREREEARNKARPDTTRGG